MKIKILITIISIAIIAAFGITAIASLTPNPSREGEGFFSPDPEQTASTGTTTTESTDATPSLAPSPSETVTPDDTDGVITPTDSTPTPTEIPTVFNLVGNTQAQDYKYGVKKVASISFFVPQISCNKSIDSLEIINAYLKTESNALISAYSSECQHLVDEYSNTSNEVFSYKSNSKMFYSENVISIRMQIDVSYGIGSGDQIVLCFNFSTKTGELLELDDVVTDKPSLIEKAIEECEKATIIEFSSGYVNYISTKICNEWYVKDGSIYLVYKPYEIASGVAGTIELSVSGDFLNI